MKKALVLALMLGSSSLAMADSSYSFQARARLSLSAPSTRDHRTSAPYGSGPRQINDGRLGSDRLETRPNPPMLTTPIAVNADCANWDPMLDPASACDAYRTQERAAMPTSFGRWTLLASRESAVPDHQYVAVETKAYSQLRIDALAGRPMFEKVGIRYIDGTTQIVQLGSRSCGSNGTVIGLDRNKVISAIVVYTVDGSRGTYTLSAS